MDDIELLKRAERAPLRTIRWQDVATLTSNAARTLARMADRGVLTRIARGVYVAPPNGADGRTWRPPLEAAALALGTARFGQRNVVLTGIGAARFWHAIPRAIAETTLAVPVRGRHPVELDTGGTVAFIHRDVEKLDATLEATELGTALVATPAQALWDLLALEDEEPRDPVDEAIRNLRTRVRKAELTAIAGTVHRLPASVRDAMRVWRDDE